MGVHPLLLAVAGAVAFLAASYLLTPAEEFERTSFRVLDLKGGRSTADSGFRWVVAPGGEVRRQDPDGDVVGRFTGEPTVSAPLAIEWKGERHDGLLLAPRLLGRELYRVTFGRTTGGSSRFYLRLVQGRGPTF